MSHDPRSVEELRARLRELGYLSHGVERLFARDAVRVAGFGREMLLVSAKAAVIVALFASLPPVAILSLRNSAGAGAIALLAALYFAGALALGFAEGLAGALVVRLRPELAVRRPAALTALSIVLALVPVALVVSWWLGFDGRSTAVETAAAIVLLALLFGAAASVFSAAILSLSIHETGAVPQRRRRSPALPLALVAAAIFGSLLLAPQLRPAPPPAAAPPSLAVTPTEGRTALVAVDGLTFEILTSHDELESRFRTVVPAAGIGGSSPERWASAGTGVPARLHGVHAVSGLRISGSAAVLQSASRFDPLVDFVARPLGIAERVPLPPAVRTRDYIWEVVASRGVTAVAVNWWATDDAAFPNLTTVSQRSVFESATPGSGGGVDLALAVDGAAAAAFRRLVEERQPRFATVWFAALDVVLNRITAEPTERISVSLRTLERLAALTAFLEAAGYDVIVAGSPGESQGGGSVVASTLPLTSPASLRDIAPTVARRFGFPLSEEMEGKPLAGGPSFPRVPGYGARREEARDEILSRDYYEKLRSLGYIR
jgi:hypothetical protein